MQELSLPKEVKVTCLDPAGKAGGGGGDGGAHVSVNASVPMAKQLDGSVNGQGLMYPAQLAVENVSNEHAASEKPESTA